MLLEDALSRRHNTTEFTERLVLPQTIDRIVRTSLHTSNFQQNYNFKVAVLNHDETRKEKIGKELIKYAKKNKDIIAKQQGECIKKSSCLLLIFANKSNENDLLTAGAFGQNVTLLATNNYLGSLWVDRVKVIEEEIDKHLPAYRNLGLCYGVCIGYRDKVHSYKRDIPPESSTIVKWYWR